MASDDNKDKNKVQTQETVPVNPNLPVGDNDSTQESGENTYVFNVVSKPVETPTLVPSEMPDIEGGVLSYVKNNIRYPEQAVEIHAQGTVYVSFVVEKDGSISNVDVLNKQKVGYGCEEEAIRVIKSGKWKAGKNNGQAVRVQLTLPVKYQLQ
jgi:protein TonB